MDKNTITGLVLIALLLVGFSYFSQPSSEQLAQQKRYNDSITAISQKEEVLKQKQELALANDRKSVLLSSDSTSLFFSSLTGSEDVVTIKNNLIEIGILNKGGRISTASLYNYKEQDRTTPVKLFDKDNSNMNFTLYNKDGVIQTENYFFTPVDKTDNSVTMRLYADESSYIDFIYILKNDSYLVDFKIKSVNMSDKLANSSYIDIDWSQKIRQLEKGFTYENRLSELTYKSKEDGVDNLSAAKNDEISIDDKKIEWIAFKNQFFSSVLISDKSFSKSKLNSRLQEKGSGYIKDYYAEMNAPFDLLGVESTQLYMYIGPNHYKTLKAVSSYNGNDWKLNRLVYLGWPLIRYINEYVVVNIFDWLTRLGLNMGIVLLILTIIVKIVVYPATLKTYMSSTKMRVLKPKIEEVNKKYPKQEDAMKKQQELMSLYSQYGVSPMGGCLPMLLQFPILMALFMFVPSAIELRQESFLWADDLSTYDAIIKFPFTIPFLGSHLSLFCLLMTVTNILNTKYTMSLQDNGSNPQMESMKWIQYLMPIMFLFILNDYPAGLNYYYFLSTLISVGIMFVLRRTTDEKKILAQLEANKKDPKTMKKSAFASRLEALQKQQEEMKKNRQ